MAEIEESAGRVNWHSVDEDFGVAAFSTAKEKRRERTVRAALDEGSTGHFAEGVGNARNPARAKVIPRKHGHSLRESRGGSRHFRGGDDNRPELRSVGRLRDEIVSCQCQSECN